jgi:O-antigen biosynthesis protein
MEETTMFSAAVTTAKRYWERNPEIASKGQWTGNPVLAEAIYERMSGGETSGHWLNWLFREYFKKRRFRRVLSPACGVGDHEVEIMSLGTIDHLDAFDFSAASLQIARHKAAERHLDINFYIDDVNAFEIQKGRKYDMIFCSGAVHHVRELERFFRVVRDALEPDGAFVFNEYVGASYNIYPPKQLNIINRLLKAIAPELRKSDQLKPFTVERAMASDSSESVRSSLIMPFAATFFDFALCRPFGGTVLHPLYPLLKHDQMIKDAAENRTIMRLIAEFEAILIEHGVLESDFVLCVCTKKARDIPLLIKAMVQALPIP